MPFDVIPAIDLRGGRVVRLRRGDFDQETIYDDDPAAVALGFVTAGATWIHLVDLDGAREGSPQQLDAIARVHDAVDSRALCEVAGGLRTAEDVDAALAAGAARAVLGTALLTNAAFARRLVDRHTPERIVAAIDVRDGDAVGEGWRTGAAGVPVESALERLADAGIRTFAVTAISRDGLLEGPDTHLLARAIALGRGDVIASGGIASLADLTAVAALGCTGAIIGRAIYEGRVDLGEAIKLSTTFPS